MNVLHIIWSSNIGGIESLVFNLCKTQKRNGKINPTIFTAKSGGALIDKIKTEGINLIEGNFKKGSTNISLFKLCVNYFKKFDVLHIHSFNPVIAAAAINSKKRIIYTEHGNFGFQRKIGITEKLSRILLKYFINNNIDFITFNSQFTLQESKKRYGLHHVKNEVVFNGIDLSVVDFNRNKNSLKPKITIGTVGRLVEVKRIDRLITAFSKVENKSNFEIKIIGDGPLMQNLKHQSSNLNLDEYITFMGFRKDLQELFKNWDLLVMSSVGEAFGLVVLEAYQSGLPVAIFTDGGGMVEIVKPNDPELIVHNEDELAEIISTLPTKITSLIETKKVNQRKVTANSFSIDLMAEKFEKIYLSL
jgi:glycosyltransferase involved in cell wall biosynthesis